MESIVKILVVLLCLKFVLILHLYDESITDIQCFSSCSHDHPRAHGSILAYSLRDTVHRGIEGVEGSCNHIESTVTKQRWN